MKLPERSPTDKAQIDTIEQEFVSVPDEKSKRVKYEVVDMQTTDVG